MSLSGTSRISSRCWLQAAPRAGERAADGCSAFSRRATASDVRAPHRRACRRATRAAVGDIDFRSNLVVFRRSTTRGVVGHTKSGREAKVPLTASLAAALKAHRHMRSKQQAGVLQRRRLAAVAVAAARASGDGLPPRWPETDPLARSAAFNSPRSSRQQECSFTRSKLG